MVAKNSTPVKAQSSSKGDDKGTERACAILSYLFFGLIWYLVDEKMRKSQFVKYHVKQGLFLLCLAIVLGCGFSIIPLFGWILSNIIWVIDLILSVMGIIYAASDKMQPLPVIGQFAEKIFTF